jgi:hypothetical protein
LEDLADEWAVKPLFFYRWWDAEDQAYVSRWAGEEWSTSEAEAGSAEEDEQFRRRQISRMRAGRPADISRSYRGRQSRHRPEEGCAGPGRMVDPAGL